MKVTITLQQDEVKAAVEDYIRAQGWTPGKVSFNGGGYINSPNPRENGSTQITVTVENCTR